MIPLKIAKLQITHFRNLSTDIIQFLPGINCIFGKNGNGKTNILEAIYFLAQRKSFRKNTTFPQLLSIDCEKPEIIFSSLWLDNEQQQTTYSGRIDEKNSQWYLNNVPTKKRPDIKVVFINPFDSFQFITSSSFRRNWIDGHLSLLDNIYKQSLKKYEDFLRFRNTLLSKKPHHYLEQITAIDKEMAPLAHAITAIRKKFLSELKPLTSDRFNLIFSEEHQLHLELESDFSLLSTDEIYAEMQQNLQKDLILGHSQKGIHRDDYKLKFDGLDGHDFCSLGQQKMAYLSLLFAYIELFRYIFNSYPIVLIDDVSGELDQIRWWRLIDYLKKSEFQVLITTANEPFREELEKIDGANKIYVSHGSISKN